MHQKIDRGALDKLLTKREQDARDKASQRLAMRTYFRKQASATLGERHWWLVKHAERNGESLAQTMRDDGIEAWCAVDKYKKRVGRCNATRDDERDIFPGYVFVKTVAFEAAWLGVMSFDGVTGVVMSDGNPARVRQKTIDEIQAFLGVLSTKRRVLFGEGAMVRIVAGAFKDRAGYVCRSENKNGLVAVECEMFGRIVVGNFGIDSLRLLD